MRGRVERCVWGVCAEGGGAGVCACVSVAAGRGVRKVFRSVWVLWIDHMRTKPGQTSLVGQQLSMLCLSVCDSYVRDDVGPYGASGHGAQPVDCGGRSLSVYILRASLCLRV